MKLSDYARQVGVTWKTANRWYHKGLIPGAYQLPTGTIIVPDSIFQNENATKPLKTIIYARVSNNTRRNTDLETQAKRLEDFAIANGWVIDQTVKEVASGLNDKRPKLQKVLDDNEPKRIIIEHKDRLTRFGYHYIETLLKHTNSEIIVINKNDNQEEDLPKKV